jgi:hypothetical protein
VKSTQAGKDKAESDKKKEREEVNQRRRTTEQNRTDGRTMAADASPLKSVRKFICPHCNASYDLRFQVRGDIDVV